MKKRITIIATLALLVVIMAAVMAGCNLHIDDGTEIPDETDMHSSAASIARQYTKSSTCFDFDKALDCFYFIDDEREATAMELLNELKDSVFEAYSECKIILTKLSYEKTSDLTGSEFEGLSSYYNTEITEGEQGTVTFDERITFKMGEVSGSSQVKNQTASLYTVKIDGKWYVDYSLTSGLFVNQ